MSPRHNDNKHRDKGHQDRSERFGKDDDREPYNKKLSKMREFLEEPIKQVSFTVPKTKIISPIKIIPGKPTNKPNYMIHSDISKLSKDCTCGEPYYPSQIECESCGKPFKGHILEAALPLCN